MTGSFNGRTGLLYNILWFTIWLVLLISSVPVWLYSKLTIKSQYEVKRLIFTPINQPFYTLIPVGSKLTLIFIDICYGRVCIQYYDVRINYSFCGLNCWPSLFKLSVRNSTVVFWSPQSSRMIDCIISAYVCS